MTKEEIQKEIDTCIKRAERSSSLCLLVADDMECETRLAFMDLLNNYTESKLKQIDNLKQRISSEN